MLQILKNLQKKNNEKKIFSSLNKKIMRLTGIIFFTTILFTIFIGGWILSGWIKNKQNLTFSKLIIIGKRYYTQNDDIRQSILAVGTLNTFLKQDVSIIQKQIERLPWIKQAIIRKQWPNELRIYLIEYVPVAYWNKQRMIDVNGNSFFVPTNRLNSKKLPMLSGPENCKDEVLQSFLKMEEVLIKNNFTLKKVIMTNHHSWQLMLTNGVKLNLGRIDIIKRLTNFTKLYPILLKQSRINCRRIKYIDLRYNSGAAVGWDSVFIH